MANLPEPLTTEHLAELDARYRSPAPLEDWLDADVPAALWENWLTALKARRTEVDEARFSEFRQRLVRQAAIETGAVEGLYDTDRGFTRTIAELATDWVARVEQEKGHDVARLIEGQMEAYELALDIATKRAPISEAVIRQLHELVCAGQDAYEVITPIGPQRHPLPKGTYKTAPNHVQQPDGTEHSYAPVDLTPDEMHRLVEQLHDPRFEAAHPAIQSAFVHHSFVAIHPFSDGNGRVARVLASIYLVRETSLPFVLYADERDRYLTAIRAADRGQVETFARFVADRTLDTIMYLVEEFRAAAQPGAASAIRTLSDALQGPGGLTHQEIDAVAERLREVVRQHLHQYVSGLSLPRGIAIRALNSQGDWPVTDPYRPVFSGNSGRLHLRLLSNPPAQAQVDHSFDVLVAKDRNADHPFRVVWIGGPDVIDFRFEDAYPLPRTAAMLRLQTWLHRILDQILGAFAEHVAGLLREGGYRG